MDNKILYHKKFKHAEITMRKNNRKEMLLSGIAWTIILGLALWYFTK